MVERMLVSGFGPDNGGVGRLMAALIPRAHQAGVAVLHRPMFPPVRPLLRKGHYLEAVCSYLDFLWNLRVFNRRVAEIRGKDLIVLHPQVIGWKLFFRLCERNRVTLYIMDNGYFCIKSYNHRSKKAGECLDCLGDPEACAPECKPFPHPYRRSENLEFLKKLRLLAGRISFMVQNEGQQELLRQQFGDALSCRVVGMRTDEFDDAVIDIGDAERFDLVYHGGLFEAKGVLYVVRLAAYLSQFRLMIPASRVAFERRFPGVSIPANVIFKDITWESGLKEAVAAAGLVLCPSLWSAPIEGALVKSILVNGRVAVYDTRYGYQAEIPTGLLVRLNEDLEASAANVRQALDHGEAFSACRIWMQTQIDAMNMSRVFDTI